jgi:hypothetical protein
MYFSEIPPHLNKQSFAKLYLFWKLSILLQITIMIIDNFEFQIPILIVFFIKIGITHFVKNHFVENIDHFVEFYLG